LWWGKLWQIECHSSIFYQIHHHFCKTLDFRIIILHVREWRFEMWTWVQRYQTVLKCLHLLAEAEAKFDHSDQLFYIHDNSKSWRTLSTKKCTSLSITWPIKLTIISNSASLNTNRFSKLMKDNFPSGSPKFFYCQ